MQNPKSYPIHQSALFKVTTKARLAELLRCELNFIRKLCSDKNYALHKIQKKGGDGTREVQVPCKPLKLVQKRIKVLLSRIIMPGYVISNRKGFSHVDNAKQHQENSFFLTTDINKFFPNCKREHVASFCQHQLFMSPDVADLFSRIVTFKGFLPTGSPSSPILSYWMYSMTFDRLSVLAQRSELKLTLYVDDLTFSSNKPFPKKFLGAIKTRLKVVGLELKSEKTKFYAPKDHKNITGAVLTPDKRIVVPNRLRQKIINDAKVLAEPEISYQDSLKIMGRIYSSRQIESNAFAGILRKVKQAKIEEVNKG